MTRAQLVDATYDAAERLNELKMRYGRISRRAAAAFGGASAKHASCARRLDQEIARDGVAERHRPLTRRDLALQHIHGMRQARTVLAAARH